MQATTVAAQGTAETKFNRVTFNVVLVEDGQTVPNAKAKLTKAVDGLNESVESLKKTLNLEFVKNSVRTGSSTSEKIEYNRKTQENENLGFTMTYSMSFDIDDLDLTGKVYDALTSIPKVNVRQPFFTLKNHDRLNKRALKAAWKKVEERFAMECETLGLTTGDFEVANWETSYSDSQRSDRVAKGVRAFAATAGRPGAAPMGGASRESADDSIESAMAEPAIGFTVGLASVTVNLEVGYARKVINVGV